MANSRLPCHRNLSVATRNTLVITRINKGATTLELEHEFDRQIETLLASIRDSHYKSSRGAHMFKELRERLKENDRCVNIPAPVPQPETKPTCTPVSVQPSVSAPAKKKDVVYLVETSTLLNVGMSRLLALDNGEALFYIPRFCIDDLAKMSKDDPRAKDALTKMYDEEVFKKRLFPHPNVSEEDSIFKGSSMKERFKRRSLSIVDVAVDLALNFDESDDFIVKVLTTSREVCDLTREVITTEGLEGLLSFALAQKHS